jgi:hypothetical protein
LGSAFGTGRDYGQIVVVLGICVAPSSIVGNTTASVVVLEGTLASPTVVDAFEIKSAAQEDGDKIVDVARGIASKLSSTEFTDAVIRTADFFAARGSAASSLGPQCDGAIALVLRERMDRPVMLRRGRDIATAIGIPKAEVEARGRDLVKRYPKAAAAALSALPKA